MKYIYKNKLIVSLVFLFNLFAITGQSQDDSFIFMENGKFMKSCEEFYPLGITYVVKTIFDINGKFHIMPYHTYCPWGSCNYWSCGIDSLQWANEIQEHIDKIADMGFNFIRLNGLGVRYKSNVLPPPFNDNGILVTSSYFRQVNPDTLSCIEELPGYEIKSTTFERQAKLMKEFVEVVRQHNSEFPDKKLRIMFLTGTHALSNQSQTYQAFLEYIGEYFASEPLIFSYEINSEPVFFDGQAYGAGEKYEKANDFGNWYYAMKSKAPCQYITFGATPYDVINWDANTFPVDFINFHYYPKQKFPYNGNTLERYNSIIKWFSESYSKPWIFGETSIAGNDSVHYKYNDSIVTELQQKEYAINALVYSKYFESIGFTWWVYKEVPWYNDTVSVTKLVQNYFGLVRKDSLDEISKPADSAFIAYEPFVSCDTCTEPDSSLYSNFYGFEDIAAYGHVVDENNNGIKNAFIMAFAKLPTKLYSSDIYFTFSNSSGYYEIHRDPEFKIWKFIVSYPGMSDTIHWQEIFPGDSAELNFQLTQLNPDSLPSPISNKDTIFISNGEITIWDSICLINSHYVVIDSNSKLIIKDTVYVKPDTKIIVQRGGKLEIDNGAIIGLCQWKGIEVWGTKHYSPMTINAHGSVVLKNGALIENALVGIKAIKTVYDQESETVDYNFSGGWVRAESGSVFRNCVYGVQLFPYNYSYSAYFSDVTFETTDSLLNSTGLPNTQIYMNQVYGIDIKGCTFINSREFSDVDADERGMGIYSYNSGFTVIPYCTSQIDPCPTGYKQPNRFEKLYYGIKALNSGSVRTFTVDSAEFIDNIRALYSGAVDNITVIRCNFEMGAPFSGNRGIYLDECTGYTIEENDFYDPGNVSLGLIVNQSGEDLNEIYRNRFFDTKFGILAQNENRNINGTGLQIKCNEFSGNNYDLAVTYDLPQVTKRTGIALYQGSQILQPDAPAGNLFSYTGPQGTNTDINNIAPHINYYYHDYEEEPLKPLYYDSLKVTIIPNSVLWIPGLSCPSNIDTTGGGGQTEEELKGVATTYSSKADSVSQLIETLEDAGNTAAMKWEVDMSAPPQSLEVYNELMSSTPYISDSVMASAIEKETVLVDAMIRDVMVASPESAKNDELIEQLGERSNPLPEYMLGQILQGRSLVSVYGDLMAKGSFYRQQQANALKRLKQRCLIDTLNPTAGLDSLVVLLEQEQTKQAGYERAFLYGELGEWSMGLGVMENIPQQFNLSGEDLAEHENLGDYYALMAEMDGGVPDSTQTTSLIDLAGQSGKAKVYARNFLLSLGLTDYEEPVIYPDMLKSAGINTEYARLIKQAQDHSYLEVFPNPAKDYFIVKWDVDKVVENLMIRLTNQSGQPVLDLEVKGKQNQQVVKTDRLKTGIYLVTLYVDDQVLESEKISIIH